MSNSNAQQEGQQFTVIGGEGIKATAAGIAEELVEGGLDQAVAVMMIVVHPSGATAVRVKLPQGGMLTDAPSTHHRILASAIAEVGAIVDHQIMAERKQAQEVIDGIDPVASRARKAGIIIPGRS